MVVLLQCDKTYKHDTKFESLGETSKNEYVSGIPCVVHVNVYTICDEAIFVCDITYTNTINSENEVELQ